MTARTLVDAIQSGMRYAHPRSPMNRHRIEYAAQAIRAWALEPEQVELVARALHADACPEDCEPCNCGGFDREAEVAIRALLGGGD